MSNKYCALDFEYRDKSSRDFELVCVCYHLKTDTGYEIGKTWLENNATAQLDFWQFLRFLRDSDYTFVGFSEAEARCIQQITGWGPTQFKYIDLLVEDRMMCNHLDKHAYGDQLLGGKPFKTRRKPFGFDKEYTDKKQFSNAEHNLAACIYRYKKVIIDTDHKKKMRDLIISGKTITDDERQAILDYCLSDTEHLLDILSYIWTYLSKRKGSLQKTEAELLADMLRRGEYSSRTAKMTRTGYPIDLNATKFFSDSVPQILVDMAERYNAACPEVAPFVFDKKNNRYTKKEKPLREWIETQRLPSWMKTATNELSLSLEAFEKWYSSSTPGPGGEMVKYLKAKQSLNGFLPKAKNAKGRSFWESVGQDGRVRPHFGIYVAQSSRSQPSATGFLFLKSKFMRSFCVPSEGKMIVGIDYGSQEFYVSALLSKDLAMIDSYDSGDVYLDFAKKIGAVPKDGLRKDYEFERDYCKSGVLGISYAMGPKALGAKLTVDTGKPHTETDGERLIELFQKSYPKWYRWYERNIELYEQKKFLMLPDGWIMWGNNPNWRSVGNCPVQGFGAVAMRAAVSKAQDAGLDVIMTLHDALYVELDFGDWAGIDKLRDAMVEGFSEHFKDPETREMAKKIKLDVDVWSPGLCESDSFSTQYFEDIYPKKIYVHKGGVSDFNHYRKYLRFSHENLGASV